MTDSVAIDAKRILLRYGAPIAVLDKVSQVHRIEFAREIAKTSLPDRESRLRDLLSEHAYLAPGQMKLKRRGRAKAAPAVPAPGAGGAATPKEATPAVKAAPPVAKAAKPTAKVAKPVAKVAKPAAKVAKPAAKSAKPAKAAVGAKPKAKPKAGAKKR